MADRNTFHSMRQDMLDVGVVDQNGHYRRKADGSILYHTDEDGNDLPFHVSKAGIVPPPEKLVLRSRAVKRSYTRYPLCPSPSMEAIAERNGDANKSPWLNMENFAENPPHGSNASSGTQPSPIPTPTPPLDLDLDPDPGVDP